jgi:hypothetical protein
MHASAALLPEISCSGWRLQEYSCSPSLSIPASLVCSRLARVTAATRRFRVEAILQSLLFVVIEVIEQKVAASGVLEFSGHQAVHSVPGHQDSAEILPM